MDRVRTIEAGALPARFARGWHCLGLAAGFRDGGPHAVAAFGTKLVVFADSSGALHVLDDHPSPPPGGSYQRAPAQPPAERPAPGRHRQGR